MDDLLGALLSRDAMPEGAGFCRHCDFESIAIWRCKDCVLASPRCRSCMRLSHKENPFHRIEQWNGRYYRAAELWEVGSYVVVPHNSGEPECDTIKKWCNQLDIGEKQKDYREQELLHRTGPAQSVPVPDPVQLESFDDSNIHMEKDDISIDDEECLDDLIIDDESEDVNPHITSSREGAGPEFPSDTGNYIRVVHTNGLHTIGMVSCECHGPDELPIDLFAAKLLPTSFKRIRTVFTAQVLDIFRLCNLELKASAYQFYQLLRRLTRPMSPAEVIDLYREFRRMSRLWRWMKKLKWAGYGSNGKKVIDVTPGELAIYCPACPQPGINIPDNWMEDPNRHVKFF